MIGKIGAIARKELYLTFTDRNLILLMIAVPLAVSTIIGLAFGGMSSSSSPIEGIPVALINYDEGGSDGQNFGDIFVQALIPPAEENPAETDNTLFDLTDTVLFDAALAQELVERDNVSVSSDIEPGSTAYVEAVARAAVDRGIYTAAIIIPADFTRKASFSATHLELETTGIHIYANSGRIVSAGILRSVTDGILNGVMTGNIAVASLVNQLFEDIGAFRAGQVISDIDFESLVMAAIAEENRIVSVDTETIEGTMESSTSTDILVRIGSSQAMFFALFTAQFGVFGLYDERRHWTLQRLIMSPTPRFVILTGKLIGVFVTVLFQLLLLLIALSIVGSLMQGELVVIWGTDFLRITFVLGGAALAVSGLGMLMAGIARNPEQGQIFGSVLNMALAVLGGAFGFQLPEVLSRLSMVYWGGSAFEQLSSGQADIGTHVIVLVVQGVIMFALGLALFNRRFEAV